MKPFNPSQKSPGFRLKDECTLFSAREGASAKRPRGSIPQLHIRWSPERYVRGSTKIFITAICTLTVGLSIASFILKLNYAVPILTYHSIMDAPKENRLAVSPASFERQMAFLKRHDYNVISLDELIDLIKQASRIPPRTICITFDDGYENNYTKAFPVLKKYNFPATLFVVLDWVGKRGYLSWDELKEMSKYGIDIGSHTVTHPNLASLNEAMLTSELVNSKQMLEAALKKEVHFLAYPGGAFNATVRKKAIEAGYKGACATNPGRKYPNNDIYALKRLRISGSSDNLAIFWMEISGLYTFIKEVRDED